MASPLGGIGNLSPQLWPLAQQAGVGGLDQLAGGAGLAGAGAAGSSPFQDLLLKSLSETGQLNQTAQSRIEQNLTGGDITMAETFTSLREADLALRMMIQIRNKLLDAFQELQQLRM